MVTIVVWTHPGSTLRRYALYGEASLYGSDGGFALWFLQAPLTPRQAQCLEGELDLDPVVVQYALERDVTDVREWVLRLRGKCWSPAMIGAERPVISMGTAA